MQHSLCSWFLQNVFLASSRFQVSGFASFFSFLTLTAGSTAVIFQITKDSPEKFPPLMSLTPPRQKKYHSSMWLYVNRFRESLSYFRGELFVLPWNLQWSKILIFILMLVHSVCLNLSKGESIQSSKHHLTYHGDIYQAISFRLCKSSEHKYQAMMHSKTQRFSVNSAKY